MNLQAVSRSRHAGKRWKRYSDYHFTRQDSAVALGLREAAKAMMHMPLCFTATEQGYALCALLGLGTGQNLFIAVDGRWVGGYVPAQYRGYPFALALNEKGEQMLCLDEDSGLISEDPSHELFFSEDGTPAQVIQDLLSFLQQRQQDVALANKASSLLQQHSLLEPWPLKVQLEQGVKEIQGLYRVNAAAMDALDAETLYALKQGGALSLAYAQLLSMQHLSVLETLLKAHIQVAATQAQQAAAKELDLEFLNQSETISFGGL